MNVPSPRQTQSYIRNLLMDRGLIPKSKMGQNFLIDLNLIDLILQQAELTREDAVLEVGTGTGGLTARLSDLAGAVLSVELDHQFHIMASQLLRPRSNVRLIHDDILASKNELSRRALAEWSEFAVQKGCTRFKLVANLPYAVATPVIANLLLTDIPIERMVVMVQWELAERMTAEVGTKDYGSLAVLMQSVADTHIVRRLGPSVFWPPPEVDSAIVKITPNPVKRAEVGDVPAFRVFLRDLYTHRRKNLRSALAGWPSGRRDKKVVDALLEKLGMDGTKRAEALDPAAHQRLGRAFVELPAE